MNANETQAKGNEMNTILCGLRVVYAGGVLAPTCDDIAMAIKFSQISGLEPDENSYYGTILRLMASGF